MTTTVICFKHRCLADNCKCNSPLKTTISYRTRIPPKRSINGWKKLIDYFNHNITENNSFHKTKTPLYDKQKIVESWK